MLSIGFQQATSSGSVQTISAFTPPAGAQFVMLQADDAGNIRYTLDGTAVPTSTSGLILLAGQPGVTIDMAAFLNIKFVQDGSTGGKLNAMFLANRVPIKY